MNSLHITGTREAGRRHVAHHRVRARHHGEPVVEPVCGDQVRRSALRQPRPERRQWERVAEQHHLHAERSDDLVQPRGGGGRGPDELRGLPHDRVGSGRVERLGALPRGRQYRYPFGRQLLPERLQRALDPADPRREVVRHQQRPGDGRLRVVHGWDDALRGP